MAKATRAEWAWPYAYTAEPSGISGWFELFRLASLLDSTHTLAVLAASLGDNHPWAGIARSNVAQLLAAPSDK